MSECRCLCCGKILENPSEEERNSLWHSKCSKSFFGAKSVPEISLDDETLKNLAEETVSKGLTVAGVQKKLSLHLSHEKENRLTIVGYPTGYILKPQTGEFKSLPEMEKLVMHLAALSGIRTVPNALITRRIDRRFRKNSVKLLAMEDFCQLIGRLTEEKYKSSYEKCAKVILQHSTRGGLDVAELFYRLVFCFVTGNSDMHLKNFSLVESAPRLRDFSLSPAYDLISVNVVMPEDTEEFALTMNGKKSRIKKSDFLAFAENCRIHPKAAEKMIQKILSLKGAYEVAVRESHIPETMKDDFVRLMDDRMWRLANSQSA